MRERGQVKMNMSYKSRYHRVEPIKKINIEQSMYDLVMSENADNMDCYYASYLGSKLTFAQLKIDTDNLASALFQDGVKNGDLIGVCLLTTPEVASALLAINKIGAVSFWLDAGLGINNILNYIQEYNLKILIVFEALAPMVLEIISETKLEKVIVVPINPLIKNSECVIKDKRLIYYSDYILSAIDIQVEVAPYNHTKPSIIVQSSGSTGKSKSIVHTDYNFNAAVEKMCYCDLPLYKKKRALVCAPPWVIYGLVNSIYSGLVLGIETVYTIQPKEEMIYTHLGSFDFVYGVPVYYRFLYNKMKQLERSTNDKDIERLKEIRNYLNKISVFISGGDKISEDELISWQLMFEIPIINGYGNNEVTGAAIVSPRFANKVGAIGIPMYGNFVKTFDVETGCMLSDGEIGELYISSNSLFRGYLGNEEETEKIKCVVNDIDWVRTGDLAYIDSEGYVFLKGRTRRLIINKLGYKVSPNSVENVIQNCMYVQECVVVGVEIADNDMVPIAFIELLDDYKGKKDVLHVIEELCKQKLKIYEIPRFFSEIDKIPHKENGGKQDFLLLENLAKDIVYHQNKTQIKK